MTKKESPHNIIAVCEEHASKPQEVYSKMAPDFFIGKFVKKGFPGLNPVTKKTQLEHMWVRVQSVEGKNLMGKLDNDPVFEMELKLGDTVKVGLHEIEQVLH